MVNTVVLDDRPEFSVLIEVALQKRGFRRIRSFHDPEDALAYVRKCPEPLLIITDYHMPRMNGVEFLRKVQLFHDDFDAAVVSASPQVREETEYPFFEKDNDFLDNIHSFAARVAERRKLCDCFSTQQSSAPIGCVKLRPTFAFRDPYRPQIRLRW